MVEGFCSEAFEVVKEKLAALAAVTGERGMSCSGYLKGQEIFNLWTGTRDRQQIQPWQKNTLVNVFSTTKGVVALAVQKAVDMGLITLEQQVGHYWPEYACAGKRHTKVEFLLNHRAGQPAIRARLADDAIYDWEQMVSVLAKEEPVWEPGTRHGYHMMTYGWLVGEVFRRAVGVTLGVFIDEVFRGDLGLDMHMGFDSDSIISRVANLSAPKAATEPGRVNLFETVMTNRDSLTAMALTNPPSIMSGANSVAWCKAEIPAANLHSTAQSLAVLYGKVACREGVLSERALALCSQQQSNGLDPVLLTNTRFGPGFMLQQPGCQEAEFGSGQRAFGHPGSGGSIAFADPDAELGFAFVMNQLGPYVLTDPRARTLIEATYSCIAKAI